MGFRPPRFWRPSERKGVRRLACDFRLATAKTASTLDFLQGRRTARATTQRARHWVNLAIHISAICDGRAKPLWGSKATNKKTHNVVPQTQSPCRAMCDNPLIVHQFFCARKRGTRRCDGAEQTRISFIIACNSCQRSCRGCFRSYVTIMQQIDCNPQFGLRE